MGSIETQLWHLTFKVLRLNIKSADISVEVEVMKRGCAGDVHVLWLLIGRCDGSSQVVTDTIQSLYYIHARLDVALSIGFKATERNG